MNHYLELVESINPDNILPGIESLLKKIKNKILKLRLAQQVKML